MRPRDPINEVIIHPIFLLYLLGGHSPPKMRATDRGGYGWADDDGRPGQKQVGKWRKRKERAKKGLEERENMREGEGKAGFPTTMRPP